MVAGLENFKWDVQLAGYNHNQADQKGEINYEEFIKEFDSFPWIEQIEKASQYPDKSAPTLSVKDLKTGKAFWVSMAGDRNNHSFLIGYIYPKEKKKLFGVGRARTIKWLEIYLTEEALLVKDCFKFFFERKYDNLETIISQLEQYEQMEAKNLTE